MQKNSINVGSKVQSCIFVEEREGIRVFGGSDFLNGKYGWEYLNLI